MQLTKTGAVEINGCICRFTQDGVWMVSRKGVMLGTVAMLDEVPALIEQHRERAIARLAKVEAKAAERRAAAEPLD